MAKKEMALMKDLLEHGVHFGHQTKRWNPKMKKYIFGEKSGIYIIDLEQTANALREAQDFLKEAAAAGSYVLFVGTKKQAQPIVKEAAARSAMFYVNQRWLGGTLTNFLTIRKSIKRLELLEKMKTDGTSEALSKKERSQLDKEIAKLLKNLAGIRGMDRLPGALVVVDSKDEEIAVKEANKLSIPVVGLVDTNCNPDMVDYVVPGNDDAIKSIKFVIGLLAESVKEGRDQFLAGKKEEEDEEEREKVVTYEDTVNAVDEDKVEDLIEGDIRLKSAEPAPDEPIAKKRKKPPREKKS